MKRIIVTSLIAVVVAVSAFFIAPTAAEAARGYRYYGNRGGYHQYYRPHRGYDYGRYRGHYYHPYRGYYRGWYGYPRDYYRHGYRRGGVSVHVGPLGVHVD